MRNEQLFNFLLLAFIVFSIPAHAKITDLRSSGPLQTRVQNPLSLQFLTLPIESAQTLNKNQYETFFQTAFSNVFEYEISGTTTLRFDMEMWRQALTFKYGITDTIEVGVELPFITNGSGFLDGFLNWYHDFWGLPNSGREIVPNNEFAFTLTQNGQTLIDHPSTPFGFSDTILRAKYLFLTSPSWKLAFSPAIKVPLGSSSKGLSSGHFDFGAQILAEKRLRRFHFVTQLGFVYVTGHDFLESILKKAFVQFGQSAEFQILDGLSLVAQLTGNSVLFKNVSADDLSKIALDLNIGFAGNFPLEHPFLDELFYQFSFGEDVTSTGPSADFTTFFLIGVRY